MGINDEQSRKVLGLRTHVCPADLQTLKISHFHLQELRFEFLKCFILDPDLRDLRIESEFQETKGCIEVSHKYEPVRNIAFRVFLALQV